MYDEITASHYEAYRPPLHNVILEKVLPSSRKRLVGLDIGCGTGRSSRALEMYCNFVVGIDPSQAMLLKADKDAEIEYVRASAEQIPLAHHSVDIVTIAGSLNYIDRAVLIDELKRTCHKTADIIIYDFEMDLSNAEKILKLDSRKASHDYDHSLNLDGFLEVKEIESKCDTLSLNLKSSEIVHLLLSESERYVTLQSRYNSQDIVTLLKNEIEGAKTSLSIKANICYSVYAFQ